MAAKESRVWARINTQNKELLIETYGSIAEAVKVLIKQAKQSGVYACECGEEVVMDDNSCIGTTGEFDWFNCPNCKTTFVREL